jgi:hypothetical protein
MLLMHANTCAAMCTTCTATTRAATAFYREPLLSACCGRFAGLAAVQVAFVEEPFALSKNSTGLLITVLMVAGAAACCSGMRYLSKRALTGYKTTHAPDDDFRPEAGDDDDDDDDDDEMPQGLGRPS